MRSTYEAYYFKRALNEPILPFFQFFVILEANIGPMIMLYISFFISRTLRNFCWEQIFHLTSRKFFEIREVASQGKFSKFS